MTNGTPLERLEEETRIIARVPKQVIIEANGEDTVIQILPLAYVDLEDLTGDIAKLVANFFSVAVKAMQLQVTPSTEGLDTRSAGADEPGSEAPAERDVVITPELEELFRPETFTAIAGKFTTVVSRLIDKGTDSSWEAIQSYDFTIGIKVALEVLRFNLGPELRDFFVKDVSAILGGVAMPETETEPETEQEIATSDSKPS